MPRILGHTICSLDGSQEDASRRMFTGVSYPFSLVKMIEYELVLFKASCGLYKESMYTGRRNSSNGDQGA